MTLVFKGTSDFAYHCLCRSLGTAGLGPTW